NLGPRLPRRREALRAALPLEAAAGTGGARQPEPRLRRHSTGAPGTGRCLDRLLDGACAGRRTVAAPLRRARARGGLDPRLQLQHGDHAVGSHADLRVALALAARTVA